MSIEALVVCPDAAAVRVLRTVLEEVGINMSLADNAGDALVAAARNKFDTVLVDCDDLENGCELIRRLRQGNSNRSAILFAITHGTTSVRAAFDLGANFVLEKPLSPEKTARGIRAAHGLIARERRRYLRRPLHIPAMLTLPDGSTCAVKALNLSEGGMAIETAHTLTIGTNVRIVFVLPGGECAVEARGDIAWTAAQSRAGLRFVFMSEDSRREIARWLDAECQGAAEPMSVIAIPR